MAIIDEFTSDITSVGGKIMDKSMSSHNSGDLESLDNLISELKMTNSNNDKKNILTRFSQCKKLLYYVYNPLWQFNTTSKNCKKRFDITSNYIYDNIYSLLDDLRNRVVTGHEAIGRVNTFVNNNSRYADIIWSIIDKNLKIRIDVKSINKVFDNYIPTFEVSLGYPFKDYAELPTINIAKEALTGTKKPKKKVIIDSSWFISRKLDGVRTVTVIDETGYIKFYSREGREFTTLDKVRREIQKLNLRSIVLDGEMCIVDEDGAENFTAIVSQIKRKDFTIDYPRYLLFDCLTLEEFNKRKGDIDFKHRYNKLRSIVSRNTDILTVIEQVEFNYTSFTNLKNEMLQKGWEGLIVRKNIPYEGKRSKYMLKYKLFHDFETRVKKVETGPFRMISARTGLEETIDTLTNVIIEYKGEEVSVGSGFSIDERKKIYNNPNLIIGKIITVKYFEETRDKNGKISLRFPTVKCVFDKKRDI